MITCKELANEIKSGVAEHISRLGKRPMLTIITVGDDPASARYVKGKIRDCEEVGIVPHHIQLPAHVTQDELERAIIHANLTTATILQLPIPEHLDAKKALTYMSAKNDVDGLKPNSSYIPCTAQGIWYWLACNMNLQGKHVVIINRSELVGRPLVNLLLDSDATVTVCHSKTKDLLWHIKYADIVISAVGIPKFLSYLDVKEGAIVVDVGINIVDGKLCGDYQHTQGDERYNITVTPVPGGVGLLTRAYLMKNVLEAAKNE